MKTDFLKYSFAAPKRLGWGYVDLIQFILIVSIPILVLDYVPSIFMEEGGWRISDIDPTLWNLSYLVRGYIASIFGGFIVAAYVLVTLNSENENRLSVLQIWDGLRKNFWVILKYMTIVFFVFELIYSAIGASIIFYNDDEVSSLTKLHLVVILSPLGSPIAALNLLVLTVGFALILQFKTSYFEAIYGIANYFKSTPIIHIALSCVIALLLSFDIEYFYLLNLLNLSGIQFSVETGLNFFIAMTIIVALLMFVLYFVCSVILCASIIFQFRQFEE